MLWLVIGCVGPWFGGQQGEEIGPMATDDTNTAGGDSGVDADSADPGEVADGGYVGDLYVEIACSPEDLESCTGAVDWSIEDGELSGTGDCHFPDDALLELLFEGTTESGTVTSGDDSWTWTREELDGSLLIVWSGPDGDGCQHNGQAQVEL